MTYMDIAKEIMAQLGGRRFIAMTGAKDIFGGKNANYEYGGTLTFKINGKTPQRKTVNCVRITLNENDLYTMEFMYVRGGKLTMLNTVENVYYDMMVEIFETQTNLFTKL